MTRTDAPTLWLDRAPTARSYETTAVPDSGIESLDMRRLQNYVHAVLDLPTPGRSDVENWRRFLLSSDLLVSTGEGHRASVAGLLLFGKNPNCGLRQAGVTAAAFRGTAKDDIGDKAQIRGPLTPIISPSGDLIEAGVVDRAVDFVTRNMGKSMWHGDAGRSRARPLPEGAIREAIANAVVHRDYSRESAEVSVSLYSDRLEVTSPGRLPTGLTVPKVKVGVSRAARNPVLKETLRDYRPARHRRMGVWGQMIESMRQHNGTEPDLEEHDDHFVVRLWKQRPPANAH